MRIRLFSSWTFPRCQQKTNFLKSFFAWRYMNIIFKEKKLKKSHKAVGIKVFLTFFVWWLKDPDPDPEPDPDPYIWLMDPDPDPGGPKTCGSGGSGFGSATLLQRYVRALTGASRPWVWPRPRHPPRGTGASRPWVWHRPRRPPRGTPCWPQSSRSPCPGCTSPPATPVY